jgi:triphosphoribosyl-dephospho-CoA synthase
MTVNSVGVHAQLACIWEATARKPGNVHPWSGFTDTGYLDFLASAAAIAPVLERAGGRRLGETVRDAVAATRAVASANTNLGIVLLFAPMAGVSWAENPAAELNALLDHLDVRDAEMVYEAIRMAQPGGLGRVVEQDIAVQPTLPLRAIMTSAAQRDRIAYQYAYGFGDVLDQGVPALTEGLARTTSLEGSIIYCFLQMLARFPDSLIARKRGAGDAEKASCMARHVLEQGWPEGPGARANLAELDCWLRSEGNERNPGTTADLVAASLFVALRQGIIKLPLELPWLCSWVS